MGFTPSLPTPKIARRRLWVTVALSTVLLSGLAPVQADGAVLVGRVGDGKIPAPGAGIATVRAVNPQTGVVAASADVNPSGTWRMRLPNGPYTVLAAIVRRVGARQEAITPIVRVRGSKPTRLRVSLQRKRAPKVRRRTAKALNAFSPHATPGAPVVAFKYLTGPSPNNRGKSVSDLLLTDISGGGSASCAPRVREWEHIEIVKAEIEFSNSKYTDPATRIPRGQLLEIDLFVEGSIVENADGSMNWDIRLRDTATGKVVGGDTTSVPAGGDWLEAEAQTAARLLDQICGGSYGINVALHTDGTFATHNASGALNATLTATGSTTGKTPARSFAGATAASYQDVTFTSKIAPCTYATEPAVPGSISFNLSITPAGRLHVAWDGSATLQATASVLCPDAPPIPGQVGPSLIAPSPLDFELPVDGGQQAVGGGFVSGGDGWIHSGMITIRRRPPQ